MSRRLRASRRPWIPSGAQATTPLALLHIAAIALHVLFGAAWFGLAIALSIVSKEAAHSDSRGAAIAARAIVDSLSAVATVFYGFAVLNVILGSLIGAAYSWPYHLALALGLVLLVAQFALIRPGAIAMRSHLGTPLGRAGRSRIGLGLGIGQAAWLGMVLLMYVHRLGTL